MIPFFAFSVRCSLFSILISSPFLVYKVSGHPEVDVLIALNLALLPCLAERQLPGPPGHKGGSSPSVSHRLLPIPLHPTLHLPFFLLTGSAIVTALVLVLIISVPIRSKCPKIPTGFSLVFWQLPAQPQDSVHPPATLDRSS